MAVGHHTVTRYAVMLCAAAIVLGACGGAAVAPSPSPTAAVATATLPPATVAPTAKPTPASTVKPTAATLGTAVAVEAGETTAGAPYFKADHVAVAAGKVTFTFTNKGKLTHEIMVYPIQDISAVLAGHRAGKEVEEMELIKGMAAMQEDVDPGKTLTLTGTLKPGFYEIGCHVTGKNPDGTSYTHFDKGQFLTLAAVGAGGPSAAVIEKAPTMTVDMTGDEAGSWLFVPDRLIVPAGTVTFKVTNRMKQAHDFVVSPQGDTSKYVASSLMPGMAMHNDDYSSFKGTELLEDLDPGKTETKTFTLTPGTWVVACYMTSKATDGTSFIHRDRGQRFVFEVR